MRLSAAPQSLCVFLLAMLAALLPGPWPAFAAGPDETLTEEEALDLHCLREAYPALRSLEADGHGRRWLVFADGRRVLYRDAPGSDAAPPGLAPAVDVAASMAEAYPLEPARPDTPPGVAPGRLRPYALLEALYGADREGVSAGLVSVPWQGRPVRLSGPAAKALERVARRLAPLLAARPALGPDR